MDNGDIFNNINTIIRKEKEGQSISPAQFSELLQLGSWEKANTDFFYYEQNQVITDSLRSLETEESVAITSGSGNISSIDDYWHVISVTHAEGSKAITPIDIVTEVEYPEYAHSDLVQPTLEYPILSIVNNTLKVLPATVTEVAFRYLKKPNTPFYDYYTDTNDEFVYILPDTEYSIVSGETYIDKDDGTEHAGPYTITASENKSVELSYPENERVSVMYMILEKVGVAINEQDALQYGMAREQKEEAQ